MNYLFLDFDGVLNSTSYIIYEHVAGNKQLIADIDPVAVMLLNELVLRTECKIVVSSTWRLGRRINELQQVLVNAGFKYPSNVIDKTIDSQTRHRGDEIHTWLNDNKFDKEKDKYVILDDDCHDIDNHGEHLVQTLFDYGLGRKEIEKCVDMFGYENALNVNKY